MNDELRLLRLPLALSLTGYMIIELFWPYSVHSAVGFGCVLSAVIIAGKRSPLVSLPLTAVVVAWSHFMPGAARGSPLNGLPFVLGWLLGCAMHVGGRRLSRRRLRGEKPKKLAHEIESDD